MSWSVTQVSDMPAIGNDPAVAVDAEGNAYYVFQNADDSHIYLSSSTDQGATWSEAIDITPPGITAAHLPALTAGDAGRLAMAWVGTDDPEGFEQDVDPQDENATWDGFISLIADATSATPVVTTARVNPADDPLVRGHCGPGRCPGLTDFIDVQMDAEGRPWAAFVDACTEECASDPDGENNAADGFVAAFSTGPSLLVARPSLAALS